MNVPDPDAQAKNLVLIGMPGVGKSTVGILLAKRLNMSFIDTDVHIQSLEGHRLQELIDTRGLAAFLELEQRCVAALQCAGTVIATGGSVVYGPEAMAHLKAHGRCIHLWLPLPTLTRRVTDLGTRGVVMEPGQTFAALYSARQSLYRQYADLTVDCSGLGHEQVVDRVEHAVNAEGTHP